MTPLSDRTIATIGSGVMAEAMIAGLLRGELVAPDQIVASHPRAERRDHLRAEYGIRVVGDNREAIEGADVVLLGIKPQMLAKVGREIGPSLVRGQVVLSVLAGATTKALVGTLGHDQVIRAMPNTPARLGKGVTVWYATPATTEEQRAQAAALLAALGTQIEVDDEKMVAMATAVSGTGPTYVFLVMEALIDAAVHLGFPRHVAHDLVVETLEGSAALREAVGDAPGRAPEHGDLARRDLRRGAPRARVRPAPDRPVRGRLGGVPADGRARRPARGQRRRRARGRRSIRARPARVTAVATGSVDLRRAPLAELRAIDFRAPGRDYWADEAALHDRLVASWAGLDDAAWRLPGAAPSDAGGPDWSLLDHVGHLVDWWELAAAYIQRVIDGDRWPTDDDYDGGDFDTFNEGRRARFADVPPAELRARISVAHAAALAIARRLPAETIRSDAAWGWVHQVLHGHAIDHLTIIEPWTDQLRNRQVGNDPFGPDPQPTRATLADGAKPVPGG